LRINSSGRDIGAIRDHRRDYHHHEPYQGQYKKGDKPKGERNYHRKSVERDHVAERDYELSQHNRDYDYQHKDMTRRNISTMIVAEIVVAAAVAIIGMTEMEVRIVGTRMIKSEFVIEIGCSYFVECGWMV